MSARIDYRTLRRGDSNITDCPDSTLPPEPEKPETAGAPAGAPLTVADWLSACPVPLSDDVRRTIATIVNHQPQDNQR